MKLSFCEAFLDSRTSYPVILLECEHALSFFVYNDVCPTLCSTAAWNVSDATRRRDRLNESS
jgi:hypothetical protein